MKIKKGTQLSKDLDKLKKCLRILPTKSIIIAIAVICFGFAIRWYSNLHDGDGAKSAVHWVGVVLAIVFALWFLMKPKDNKSLEDTNSQKYKLPKIKFKDSGWVLVYVICGWISCVGSLTIVFVGALSGSFKTSVISALPILFAGLGSLLAAHILRLLEKGVHHLESGVRHLKSIDENKKPPN